MSFNYVVYAKTKLNNTFKF